MLHWIGMSLTFGIAVFAIAFGSFFFSSLAVFMTKYWRGTIAYVVKTVIIGIVIMPIALLLTIWAFATLARWLYSKAKALITVDEDSTSSEAAATVYDTNDEPVVHLIHGTFEQDAEWTLSDSPMCKSIKKENPSVKLNRFVWSGFNTHQGRQRAARELAGRIQDSLSDQHFIVAHSHAGNIVRELSQIAPHLASKIQGVALLSPPFIFRRRIARTGGNFVLIHSLGFALVAQLLIAPALSPFGLYGLPAVVLSSLVTVLVELGLAKRYAAQLKAELDEGNEGIELRDVQILHAIGDEADSLLRFVSFLHETCFGLFSQLQATKRKAEASPHGPYWLSLAALAAAAAAAAYDGTQWWWAATFCAALCLNLVALVKQVRFPSKEEPGVLIMAALPAAVFSFWLGAAKSLAYGDWRLLLTPDVFICSSETPAGDYSVLKYAPRSDGALVHSTHSHPTAISDVASWLRSRLAK